MLKDLKRTEAGFEDEDGVTYESRELYMYTKMLPSCGCGDPEALGRYVHDMLIKNCTDFAAAGSSPSYDDLPTMFFLNWADREGYTEHGTTVRLSWLTPKGKELLQDLKTVLSLAS